MKPTFAYAPKAFAFFQTTMFSMFFKAIFFSYWNSLSASKDFRWLGVHTSNSKNTTASISAQKRLQNQNQQSQDFILVSVPNAETWF